MNQQADHDELAALLKDSCEAPVPPPAKDFVDTLGTRLQHELSAAPRTTARRGSFGPWGLCGPAAAIALGIGLSTVIHPGGEAGRSADLVSAEAIKGQAIPILDQCKPDGDALRCRLRRRAFETESGGTLDRIEATARAALAAKLVPHTRVRRTESADRVLGGHEAIFVPSVRRPVAQQLPRPHNGTVAHWRFDQGPADSASDGEAALVDLVNGFKGTPFGQPVYRSVDGKVGLEFDGKDDRLFVPDHPSFAMTKNLTLEAVIRYDGMAPDSVYRNCIFFRGDERGGFDPYYLSVTRTGHLCFHVAQGTPTSDFVQVIAPQPLPKGKWLHVAGTLEDATCMLRLFIDRKEVSAAFTNIRPLAWLDSSHEPGIGIGSVQSAKWKMSFDGLIAEVRISDLARKPDEFLPCGSDRIIRAAPRSIEVYFNRRGFEARLDGAVHVVNFDDIETTKDQPLPFSADHYEKDAGVIIKGTDGQYVAQTFDFPEDFIPSSPPNMYAPGPRAPRDAPKDRGGCDTDITFAVNGQPAAVAAFGAVFIDADYPDRGPSSLAAYDHQGKLLAQEKGFHNRSGGRIFRGMIAVNEEGKPVTVIAKVHLTNGNEWPSVNVGEGVALDDFLFAVPVAR